MCAPTSFILPDLVSHCPFPLVYNPSGDAIAQESVNWLDTSCPELSAKQRKALYGLKAGELTGYCYPTTPPSRLRVVSDFMNYLFHLDNISDGMLTSETESLSDCVMNSLWVSDFYRPTTRLGQTQPSEEPNAGKLARESVTYPLSIRARIYKWGIYSFWTRCIPDAGPGTQARFKETLAMFFEAVSIQAEMRDAGCIPDLESYIALRRDTSGCKPCWVLIEYGLDIDLPDFVAEDPVIMALNQSTNDLVTWSNDIFSYNVEQSRGDTHNMIIILMKYHGHTLQSAMDYVGELCRSTIDAFIQNRASLPAWEPEIQAMVERYVQGLEAWIVGSLHWSFMTERYFGTFAAEVKKHRFVSLRPASS
ncbi:terpenoid synthase [Mycena galopus ATCC 62051]|nr:terpenoid synthase [Mycena galopus ATCC 62051]